MYRSTFEMRYSIWYHLYNLKNLKTPQTIIKKSFLSTKKLVRCLSKYCNVLLASNGYNHESMES